MPTRSSGVRLPYLTMYQFTEELILSQATDVQCLRLMVYLEPLDSCLNFKAFIIYPGKFCKKLCEGERLDMAASDEPRDDQSHSM